MVNLQEFTNERNPVTVYSPTRVLDRSRANAGTARRIMNRTAAPSWSRAGGTTTPQFRVGASAPTATQMPQTGGGGGMRTLDQMMATAAQTGTTDQQGGGEAEGGWRGLLGHAVNNPILQAALVPLNILDTPRRVVTSSLKEFGDIFAGGASAEDWWNQVKDPNFGVGTFLHVDGPNNLFNRWVNRAIGLTGDVVLDPMTWIAGSSAVTGASRRARLIMGAEASAIEGISRETAETIVRRGIGTVDDATRQVLRDGGVAVRDAGYYWRLPLMRDHQMIPGTAALDRLSSRTFGRVIPAVSNNVVGGVLNHWNNDEVLQDAARRMLTGDGPGSFQSAAGIYLFRNSSKAGDRMAEKAMSADLTDTVRRLDTATLNEAIHEAETKGTGPVAEYFARAAERNRQAGVRHGIITRDVNGQRVAAYVPHYETPEFRAWLTGSDPNAASMRKLLEENGWSAAKFDEVSQSMQRRMLVPSATAYKINGHEFAITEGTVREFNEIFAKLVPDAKFKALEDDFATIAKRYNGGAARDIGKMTGVRKVLDTGLIRKGADADAMIVKAVNEAKTKIASGDEVRRMELLLRTHGKEMSNIRSNLTAQYSQITGALGDDVHKVIEQMQTVPTKTKGKLKALVEEQQVAAAAADTSSKVTVDAVDAAATAMPDSTGELLDTLNQVHDDVASQMAARAKRIDELAPAAAAAMAEMDAALASGDAERILAAQARGVPIKHEWDRLVSEQAQAAMDRESVVQLSTRLATHRAKLNHLNAIRNDQSLLDLLESNVAAEASTAQVGTQRVPLMKDAPPEPGEIRMHVPKNEDVPAHTVRGRPVVGPQQPPSRSWLVRNDLVASLVDYGRSLPDSSPIKREIGDFVAHANKLSYAERELYDTATQHATAIERARLHVVELREQEHAQSQTVELLRGRPRQVERRMELEQTLNEFRAGSLAEGEGLYKSAQEPITESKARLQSAQREYHESRKRMMSVASAEDRRVSREEILRRLDDPARAEAAAQQATELIEHAEGTLGRDINTKRGQLEALEPERAAAEAETAALRQQLEAARAKRTGMLGQGKGLSTRTSPRPVTGLETVRRGHQLDAVERDIARLSREVATAADKEAKVVRRMTKLSDDIGDLRANLIRTREDAARLINPMYDGGPELDDALARVRRTHTDANMAITRANNLEADAGELRGQARQIVETFAEIEDSPKTWAARREASRQRRAIEAQATAAEEQLVLARRTAVQARAELEAAKNRARHLSGVSIAGDSEGPETRRLLEMLGKDERRQTGLANEMPKIKVDWEPVPRVPVREGLDVGNGALGNLVAEVLSTSRRFDRDTVARLSPSDFPETQADVLSSSPFGKGGQTNFIGRAKEAHAHAADLITNHQATLLEPHPNTGVSAVSREAMAAYQELTADLGKALDRYAASPLPGNYVRLNQMSQDAVTANAYMSVYKEALAVGVEPSPEVGAMILAEVKLREGASMKAQERTLAATVSEAGHAQNVAKFTEEAEAAYTRQAQAQVARDEMIQWREIDDERFDPDELQRRRRQLSDANIKLREYYDEHGQLKVPVRDAEEDAAELSYLSSIVEEYIGTIDDAQAAVARARSNRATTVRERTVQLEGSIDYQMGTLSNLASDNQDLLEAIQRADAAGEETVRYRPRVAETTTLSIPEAEEMLRKPNLPPRIRQEVYEGLAGAREALLKQQQAEARKLALDTVAESDVNEVLRAARAPSEVRTYRMTPEGTKGELLRTSGTPKESAAAARQFDVNVEFSIWQPSVATTELPLEEARAMYGRNQARLRKGAGDLESTQLEYDVLSGEAPRQLDYIRAIMDDETARPDPAVIEAEAARITEAASQQGRELTEDEAQSVALLQARAEVRRQNPDGLPADTKAEMLSRSQEIQTQTEVAWETYNYNGKLWTEHGQTINSEVERILDQTGELTVEDLQFLAQVLPPEQSRLADTIRMTLDAMQNVEQGVRLRAGKMLTPEQMEQFRFNFASLWGDNGADAMLSDVLKEIDSDVGLEPGWLDEMDDEVGDVGITAARRRLKDVVISKANADKASAVSDFNQTLTALGLNRYGAKSVSYYRRGREVIADQLERRGVRSTRMASEKLAELRARIATNDVILRSLGVPIPGDVAPDFVGAVAERAMASGTTIGDMLANVRNQLAERPTEEIGVATSFAEDLRRQIDEARAAGDEARVSVLGKELTAYGRRAKVYDRTPAQAPAPVGSDILPDVPMQPGRRREWRDAVEYRDMISEKTGKSPEFWAQRAEQARNQEYHIPGTSPKTDTSLYENIERHGINQPLEYDEGLDYPIEGSHRTAVAAEIQEQTGVQQLLPVEFFNSRAPVEEFTPPVGGAAPTAEALSGAPTIEQLSSDVERATANRESLEQQLAQANEAEAQFTPDDDQVDPTTSVHQQIATMDARIERLREIHAAQRSGYRASERGPAELALANHEQMRFELLKQLGPLSPEQKAEYDRVVNELFPPRNAVPRTTAQGTAADRAQIDEVRGLVPDGGRPIEGRIGEVLGEPSAGSTAPAALRESIEDLTQKLEQAERYEAQAQSRLAEAEANAAGAADPSMVDQPAAAGVAEGTPQPSVDVGTPSSPAPSPEASGPAAVTNPDIAAVQQEFEVAQSEYQQLISQYGSYEAADELGKMAIGKAAARVRKLDQMRTGMLADSETKLMRGDRSLSAQLDQAARMAQERSLAARTVTSDPEYILFRGTPSVRMMDEHFGQLREGRLQRRVVGGVDVGGTGALRGKGIGGTLTEMRPTYYNEAKRRLDNLIDVEAGAIDQIEQELDGLGVVRQITGDTEEAMARDAELRAARDELLTSAGRNSEARDRGLALRRQQEADYTAQLRDVEAQPLHAAREAVAAVQTPEGARALGGTIDAAIADAKRAVEEAEWRVELTMEELDNLVAGRPAPTPAPGHEPGGPFDYSPEDLAANQLTPEQQAAYAARGISWNEPPPPGSTLAGTPPKTPGDSTALPPNVAQPPATNPVAPSKPVKAPAARKAAPPTEAPAPKLPSPAAQTGPTVPKKPGRGANSVEWQAVLNDLNDINEARRLAGGNDPDINKVAALLTAAADSVKELNQHEITYDLVAKRLADFRKGSQQVSGVVQKVVADGWRELTWSTLPEGEKWVIADDLAKGLDNLQKALSIPDSWNVLDHYTRFFKTYATGRPGFHVRNAMSAFFMNLVAGVRLRSMWDSMSLWRQFEKAPHEFLAGLEPGSDLEKAFTAVFGSGAAGTFEDVGRHFGEDIGSKVWKGVIDNRYTRWNQRMGARVEGTARLGMALDSVRRGSGINEAMNRIAKFHFDYTEMTRMDRQMRRIIPFWTFISRNLPLQIEQMWARPRVYLQYQSLVRNFGEVPDPLTPQYWLDAGAFTMDDRAADDTANSDSSWLAQLDLPMNTAMEPINAALEGNFGKAILSDINPAILAPMEAFGFNRKLYTGAPLEEGSYHAPNPAQVAMLPIFNMLGATAKNAQGETVIDDRYAHLMRTLNPIMDMAERFTDTSGTRAGRQDETLMRFLGIPVRELTPEMRASTQRTAYYDQRDELAQRRRLAQAGTR